MKKIVKNKKRVFVGLSGGVDSAVAAALLKKQGYDVAGVFMRFWKPRISADFKAADGRGWENSCCSAESEATARLVAGKLGIPFYVFNFAKEFKRVVVNYFLRELAAGRTPNPCVVCNQEIKFGLFLARAKKLGADYIAMGHYARLRNTKKYEYTNSYNLLDQEIHLIPPLLSQGGVGGGNSGFNNYPSSFLPLIKGRRRIVKLFVAKDKQKDQSYFLYRLSQE
ncbi:hypothetical protein KKF25_01935, partial [Patescibacteria group bacterium]|nr:hypothetical protein [Patescibacteria group bacterium]